MSAFKIKENLPQATRDEIDRISAIPSAQRLQSEADFLTALAPYLVNEVILRDSNDLIVKASGNDIPTGDSGFKKGAIFIKKNADDSGLYTNDGDETSATWTRVDTDTFENVTDTDAEDAPVNAVSSSATLTSDNTNPSAEDTLTVNGRDYTFVTSLTEVKSNGTITSTANGVPTAEDTVVVGDETYTFVSALSTEPTVANEVLIGVDGEATLQNLADAINGDEDALGVGYSEGTVANADVSAGTPASSESDYVLTVTALVPGTAGNALDLTEDADNITVSGTGKLASGVNPVVDEILIGANADATLENIKKALNHETGEGTNYSTGTVVNADVTAGTVSTTNHTVALSAKIKGVIGDDIEVSEESSHLTFGEDVTTLSDGVDGTPGTKGQKVFTSTYEYTCIADNTIHDANWRRVSLGTAY